MTDYGHQLFVRKADKNDKENFELEIKFHFFDYRPVIKNEF